MKHLTLFIPAISCLALVTPLNAQQENPERFTGTILKDHEDRIAQLEARLLKLERLTEAEGRPVQQTGAEQKHVIQAGESLYSISRHYGLHVTDLAYANGISQDQTIQAGRTLLIPKGAKAGEEGPPPVSAAPPVKETLPVSGAKATAYTVREGDTLTAIARRHGVTVNHLLQANQLPNANAIRIGQELRIQGQPAPGSAPQPAAPKVEAVQAAPTYHYYDVMAGDTLASIAGTFFTSEDELRKLNQNLPANGNLQLGQQIVVPTTRYFEYLRKHGHAIS